jgi:butyryl-CoA dehydrogenase
VDFRLTTQQEELRSAAREFAQAELPHMARQCEETGEPPPSALVRRYAELGFLGVNVPTELGGLGLGNIEALLILEEFAKISSAVAFPVTPARR